MIKNHIKLITTALAIVASIATALTYFIPDKSNEYAQELILHQSNLSILIDEIYEDNKKEFFSYRDMDAKIAEKQFNNLVLNILKDKELKNKADLLIGFLDKIAACEADLFCKISNSEIKYDEIMYASWYWLRPYIVNSRKTYISGFGKKLEQRAYESKLRINK